jgi:hypothetical protein
MAKGETEKPKHSTDEMIRRCREMMVAMREDLQEAVLIEAVFAVGNQIVAQRIGERQTYAAHSYNAIHRSLLANLILLLNRIYDFSKNRLLVNQDKASIPVILAHLKEPPVLQHWQTQARLWNDPDLKLEQYNADLVCKKVDSARGAWDDLRSKPESAEWLRSLRKFRDGRIAHSLIDFKQGDLPRYTYLGQLLTATLPIAADLRLAIEGASWDTNSVVQVARKNAEAFWPPVIEAMLR